MNRIFRFGLTCVGSLLALGSFGQTAFSPPYAFTEFAGTPGVSGTADGLVRGAQFSNPTSVAVDSAGNVYVADARNSTIRKVTPAGVVSTWAGTAGQSGSADGAGGAALFAGPMSVALDANGNLYVANYSSNTIRKITPFGIVSTLAGSTSRSGHMDGIGSAAQFKSPEGVAVDSVGNVYVADTGNNTIRKITPGGVVSTLAGTALVTGYMDGTGSAAQFDFPRGLALDSAGNVYVADSGNNTIRRITPSGLVTTLAGTAGQSGHADGTGSAATFLSPWGVAVTSTGALYVADAGNNTIRSITPAGIVTTLAGTAGIAGSANGAGPAAQFDFPSGLALDSAGNVYVSDSGNDTIRKMTPAGAVTTLAGIAGAPGNNDGTDPVAQFYRPGIGAVDRAGNIYVMEDYIRVITPAGIVTTLAGTAGVTGSQDGMGPAAQFNGPQAAALDSAGNLYVADNLNSTIRKVTPAGMVTTLAGTAGVVGSQDGTGAAAQFANPDGVAVDANGNVYVLTAGFIVSPDATVRKITPAGVVTTLAGTAGVAGSRDGLGPAAQFDFPQGIAVDANGNLYIGDTFNNTVRKITPAGAVSTLAGTAGVTGSQDGMGPAAQFNGPAGVTVDASGNIYVADIGNNTIRKISPVGQVTTLGTGMYPPLTGGELPNGPQLVISPSNLAADANGNFYFGNGDTIRLGFPAAVPSFMLNPSSQTIASGRSVVFNAVATGTPAPTYQWVLNGRNDLGNDQTLVVPSSTSANAGTYVCVASNSVGTASSSPATLSVVTTSTPGYLLNLSGRAYVGTGSNTLIGGFAIVGTGSKEVLVRGIGPGLNDVFGLPGFVPNPSLALMNSVPIQVGQNNSWGGTSALTTAFAQLGAFALEPASVDTALLASLPTSGSANYTALVTSGAGGDGTGLVELYDADSGAPAIRLVNLSARALVGTGQNILIGGFAIGGSTGETVLIRAVGPGLTDNFGLTGVLAQPVLTLFSDGTPIYSNTIWASNGTLANIFSSVGAFALNSAHQDSALLITLPPGNYTAQVTGLNSGIGIALCEIYEVY